MADNKKYYYLKLKENFFESDSMILLESMKDGYLYSNILMKLYLRSLKDNGRLMLNGTIPYNSQMLASVTRHQVGTLEKALDIFKELGLIEILDSGAIYMMDIQNFIGRSSTEADRQRKYYNRIESEKSCKEECKKSYKNSTPELEIEKEIDIEKEKERELKAGQPAPAAYGRYDNVFLSDKELSQLKEELPGKWEYYLDRLSCHIASTGKQYQNHAATIYKWAQEDAAKEKPKKGIPDYSFKEGESL